MCELGSCGKRGRVSWERVSELCTRPNTRRESVGFLHSQHAQDPPAGSEYRGKSHSQGHKGRQASLGECQMGLARHGLGAEEAVRHCVGEHRTRGTAQQGLEPIQCAEVTSSKSWVSAAGQRAYFGVFGQSSTLSSGNLLQLEVCTRQPLSSRYSLQRLHLPLPFGPEVFGVTMSLRSARTRRRCLRGDTSSFRHDGF